MVFSVLSSGPGCEEKLKTLMEQIGPEMFEGVRKQEDGQLIVESNPDDQFADADSDESDLEEIKEEAATGNPSSNFVVPVVSMPVFDSYGLPQDGFNYYKFIKAEASGGDFIAAEPHSEAKLGIDSDFGKKLNAQERAVLEALNNAEEYESLSDDFLEEAAQTPEGRSEGEEEKEEEAFEKVADEYMRDDLLDDYPRPKLQGKELEALMDEFKREHPDLISQVPETSAPAPEAPVSMPEAIPFEEDHCLQRVLDLPEEDPDKIAERAYEALAYREPEERDDVESVVSTFTNTDNRPAVISVKERKRRPKAAKGEKEAEEKPKAQSGVIPENETKEEKKQRKAALKEARRTQRQSKKELKQTFASEKVRQLQQGSGKYDTPQGYSVIKIS